MLSHLSAMRSTSTPATSELFNPSHQPSPHTHPLTLPPVGLGRELEGWKFTGWENDCLIREAKAAHTSKAKRGMNSLLPMVGHGVQPFPAEQSPIHRAVTWEVKCHHSKRPLFLSPPLYTLNTMSHGLQHPWGHLGSPQHEEEQSPWLCSISNNKNISVSSSPLSSAQTQNTDPLQPRWRKLTLPQPRPAQLCFGEQPFRCSDSAVLCIWGPD